PGDGLRRGARLRLRPPRRPGRRAGDRRGPGRRHAPAAGGAEPRGPDDRQRRAGGAGRGDGTAGAAPARAGRQRTGRPGGPRAGAVPARAAAAPPGPGLQRDAQAARGGGKGPVPQRRRGRGCERGMTDGDVLRRAVVADPDDDTPRLVYADWLDENGEPARAAFIRAEVEAARAEPFGPAARAGAERAERLRVEHEGAWVRHLAGRVLGWEFVRGFVGHVTVD